MGKNVKFLMGFDVPFWAGQKGLGFSTDGPTNLVWESTENQIGPENEIALAAFSGGEDAEACLRWKASEQQTHYLQELGRAYKNADQAFVKGEFENWPGARWTKASYSFPNPDCVLQKDWRDGTAYFVVPIGPSAGCNENRAVQRSPRSPRTLMV